MDRQEELSGLELLGIGAGVALLGLGAGALVRRLRRSTPQRAAETILLDGLTAAPFPGQQGPDAAVLIPSSFSMYRANLSVWLYLRGFGNCARNVVGEDDSYCTGGGKLRHASHLATQLETSGENAIVVVPELRYDAASYEPGALAGGGGVDAFLDEVLARLTERIGAYRARDIQHLGVMTHSGGYLSAAAVVRARHPALRSVVLLDSLYGADRDFSSWIEENAARFTPEGGFRFADIWTDGGGTADRSAALSDRVMPALARAGSIPWALRDDTTRTLDEARYQSTHVLFKRSGLNHTDVTRYYPQRFWGAGW